MPSGISIHGVLKSRPSCEAPTGAHEHLRTAHFSLTSNAPIDASLMDADMIDTELPGALGTYPLPVDAVLRFVKGPTTLAKVKRLIQEETVAELASNRYTALTLPDRDTVDTASEKSDACSDEESLVDDDNDVVDDVDEEAHEEDEEDEEPPPNATEEKDSDSD